jgi:hypothetical protein
MDGSGSRLFGIIMALLLVIRLVLEGETVEKASTIAAEHSRASTSFIINFMPSISRLSRVIDPRQLSSMVMRFD